MLLLTIFLSCWQACQAELPNEYKIIRFDTESIRQFAYQPFQIPSSSGSSTTLIFSDSITVRQLYSSINSILLCYQVDCTINMSDSAIQEFSGDFPYIFFKQKHIILYKTTSLQGRILRILLSNNIPVLIIDINNEAHGRHSGKHITNADVIYAFQEPNNTQNSRLPMGDKTYIFKTAGGWKLKTPDIEILDPNKWFSREVRGAAPIFLLPNSITCNYYIVTTSASDLNAIKKVLNDGLSDVGLEYKLPKFEELKGEDPSH
jgi:hypothetical protein